MVEGGLGERDRRFMLALGERLPTFEHAKDLVDFVVGELGRYLDVNRCVFLEIDAERAVTLGEFHRAGKPALLTYPLSSFIPDIHREYRMGRVVSIADIAGDERTASYREIYERFGTRAYVCAPLMRDGVWVASLSISSAAPRAWSSREAQLLQAIGERTWLWAEHVRMVRALRESERQYRRIIETTREGVWEVDEHGRTRFVNARMAAMLGYAVEQMRSMHLDDFLDEKGRARAAANLEKRRSGISESIESKLVKKDGSLMWARLETSPLFDDHGRFIGALAMVVDISDRKQAEAERERLLAELRSFSAELEKRVEERTLELQQSLRDKEALIKEIHHRVKNNLQVVSSLLKLQAQHLADPMARAMFAETRDRIQSIALVHEKLHQTNDISSVAFHDYARSLVRTLLHAQDAAGRGITTELELGDVRLRVETAIPCGLLLNELVTNALKHAFPGALTGTIRVCVARHAEGMIELSVADDGIGLPAELDVRNATSLGLDLVFAFARQIEAEIEIRRENGTEFRLRFRERPNRAEARREEATSSAASPSRP